MSEIKEFRFEVFAVSFSFKIRLNQDQESTIGVLKKMAKQKDHLFTFLRYDNVDATNNLAERRIRPAVISRKNRVETKQRRVPEPGVF